MALFVGRFKELGKYLGTFIRNRVNQLNGLLRRSQNRECQMRGETHRQTVSENSDPENNRIQNNFHIGGHAFTLPREVGRIFQADIREIMRRLLVNNLLPQEEIERLHNQDHSNQMLGIAHPLFVDNHNDIFDNTGRARYWVRQIGGYYVCSQWWAENFQYYNRRIAQHWFPHLMRLND